MIPLTLSEIASAVGAALPEDVQDDCIRRVTTDSRDVEVGDLFVAIKGERFDGHEFIAQSAERGATACICAAHKGQRYGGDRGRNRGDHVGAGERARAITRLEVSDTIEALGRLATYYRRRKMSSSTTVVAVTGSNGKTTTKRMIDHVLGRSIKGRCSPRSFNNAIGVPLSILAVDADDRYLIAEIGTNAPGEVASLAAIVSPDIAVITSVGEAHLEGLGDLQAVAVEKASLLAHLGDDGLAVVNVDRKELTGQLPLESGYRRVTFGLARDVDLRVTDVRGTIKKTRFELDGRYRVELSMPGLHHATNAAAAFAVARSFDVPGEEIVERLRSFTPPGGRTSVYKAGGATIVDDTYNANPASMSAAIKTLQQATSGRRVLVMGDMLELGKTSATLHERIVRSVCEAGIEVLITVGPVSACATEGLADSPEGPCVICCDAADAAGDALARVLAPGDTVWIKGSRAMQLDRVVRRIKGDRAQQAAVA